MQDSKVSAACAAGVAETAPRHTPGPWEMSHARTVISGTGYTICEVANQPAREANARLISAAPELLSALEDALGALQWCSGSYSFSENGEARQGYLGIALPAMNSAHAVIRKARGV